MDRSIFCLSVSIVRKNERRRPPFFINDFTKNLGIVWTRFHNRSPIETQLADTKSPRVEGEMEVGRDQGIKSERQPLKVREGGSTDSSQPSPTRWNYLLLLFSSTLVPRRLLCREKFESCPRLDRFLPLSLSLFSLGEENRQHSSVHSTLKIELTRSRVNRAISVFQTIALPPLETIRGLEPRIENEISEAPFARGKMERYRGS